MKLFKYTLILSCALLCLPGCAKLQNDRQFDSAEYDLSFELDSPHTASRLIATIQSGTSSTSQEIEVAMTQSDSEYISESISLEEGNYTISSLRVLDIADSTIFSETDISISLNSDTSLQLEN